LFVLLYLSKGSNEKARIKKSIEEAELYSVKLNDILEKSQEIELKILPYYQSLASNNIDAAKVDFEENAISPFWDRVEEASKTLALYKEAVDQLTANGGIYSKIIAGRKHNFPIPFPVGLNVSISQTTLEDFNAVIRKAQTKFEFANIWEHRKTQKILIAGFQTLQQAIHEMKNEILSSLHHLHQSIKSGFTELRNLQIEQIKSFEGGYEALNKTLNSMNTKLYYIEYNKKPTAPFLRPLLD
jgi:hypothetical protein